MPKQSAYADRTLTVRLKRVMDKVLSSSTVPVDNSGTRYEDWLEPIFKHNPRVKYQRNAPVTNPCDLSKPKRVDYVTTGVRGSDKVVKKYGYEVKYQNSSGTTGEKLGTTALRLSKMVEFGHLDKAFIVLGGHAWDPEHVLIALDTPHVEFISETDLRELARKGLL